MCTAVPCQINKKLLVLKIRKNNRKCNTSDKLTYANISQNKLVAIVIEFS